MSHLYRALLVGTGGVADTHSRAIEDTRGAVQLVAAVDVDASRVRAFCGRHKIAAVLHRLDRRPAQCGPIS